MFTQDYFLQMVSVKGEVSNCKYHPSGHIYFTLKDSASALNCIMFAGDRRGLGFRLTEGQQVIAKGSVSVFERDGRYQLYVKEVTLDGAGALYEKYEQLKRELAAQVSDLQSPNRSWSCMGAEFWQKVMTIRRSLS